jgi:excisionase family DNA binding protein
MNTVEAAEYIGISSDQVRWLIRKGRLKAARVKSRHNQHGYEYVIAKPDAALVRDLPKVGKPRLNESKRKKRRHNAENAKTRRH